MTDQPSELPAPSVASAGPDRRPAAEPPAAEPAPADADTERPAGAGVDPRSVFSPVPAPRSGDAPREDPPAPDAPGPPASDGWPEEGSAALAGADTPELPDPAAEPPAATVEPVHSGTAPDAPGGGPHEGGTGPDDPAPVATGGPEPLPIGMPDHRLRAALEAVLLVVDEPVSEDVLAETLEEPVGRVSSALAELAREYTDAGRGFDLRRAAGGWRLYTRAEHAGYVERFVLGGQQARLTQAALETLAVVAYRQPVTRSRVAAIRGVNCDGVIRTLLTRGLVEEAGTEPETGGHLYRTTSLFLEKLGLDSVDDLPPLAPFLPEDVSGLDPDPPRGTDRATGRRTEPVAGGSPAEPVAAVDGSATEPEPDLAPTAAPPAGTDGPGRPDAPA